MALKFTDRPAQFNPKTNNVRFYGADGETEVTFAISQDILAELAEVKALNEREAVKTFTRCRNRIQPAAEKAYLEIGPGSAHAYELAMRHFEVAPEPVASSEPAIDSGETELSACAVLA